MTIVSFYTVKTFAHSVSDCGYKHSVSTTHWDIYEDSVHWGSYNTALTVDCGLFEGTLFETYINNAVSKWNAATFNGSDLMTMKIDNTSVSAIFRSKTSAQISAVCGSSAWAITYRAGAVIDSSGYQHYSTNAESIAIWVNWNDVLKDKSTTAKTHVPLHELGHVIGLKDIPATVSTNSYLMCNEFGSSAAPTSITTADKQGAAVILGQHTSHSFTYSQYSSTAHKKTCSICGVYQYYTHTYNSNGVCIYCGYTSG